MHLAGMGISSLTEGNQAAWSVKQNKSPGMGCTGKSQQSVWHVGKKTFAAGRVGGSKVETVFHKGREKDVAVTDM